MSNLPPNSGSVLIGGIPGAPPGNSPCPLLMNGIPVKDWNGYFSATFFNKIKYNKFNYNNLDIEVDMM